MDGCQFIRSLKFVVRKHVSVQKYFVCHQSDLAFFEKKFRRIWISAAAHRRIQIPVAKEMVISRARPCLPTAFCVSHRVPLHLYL